MLATVASGSGLAFLIGGEAGAGKSRLVRELTTLARRDGFTVLVGGSIDIGEGGLPFGSLSEALRPVPKLLARDDLERILGPSLAELGRILPEFRDQATPPVDVRRDPFAAARLFEVLFRLLEALAANAPLLLVLEDLHWAEESTREFLQFAATNARSTRLAVLATYRTDDVHRTHPLRPLLAKLRALDTVRAYELQPLDREGVRAQMAAILGRDPDNGLLERVHGRSLGNPFFTEELLSTSVDGDRLPASLKDTLLLRLDALRPSTRHILDVLAVVGRAADEELLTAAAGPDGDAVAAGVREALDHNIVTRTDSEAPEIAFRHALFAEAVYADLLASERARLHRQVADALEAQRQPGTPPATPNRDAELALHYRRGNRAQDAMAAAARAARAAAEQYAFADALAQWEQVLELWEAAPAAEGAIGQVRAEVLGEAAIMAAAAGHHRRAIALLQSAIAELDADQEPVRAAYAYAGLMSELFSAGDAEGAESARATALALIDRVPPTLTHVRVLNLVAYPPLFASRYAEVADQASRAVAIADELGSAVEGGWARVPLAIATAFLGRLAEAEAHLARSIAVAEATRHPQALADAYLARGVILEAAGRFDEAVSTLSQGLSRLRELGVERTHGHTLETNLAEALRRRGDWNEALPIVERVLARGGTRWEFAHANVVRGHILIGRGESADGEAALVTAWNHFGRAGTGFVGHYYAALAEHDLWAGQPDTAVQQAQAGAALIAHTGDLRWLGELTVLHVRAVARRAHAGERRDAIVEAARRSVARYEEIGRRVSAEGTIFADVFPVYLETARGELADAEGQLPDPDRWRRVATAWEEQRQPYPAAYARYRAAEASLLVGEPREQATADLVRAIRIARQLGAVPLLVEGEGLARRARIALPLDAPPEQPGKQGADALQSLGLTQRERDVLDLLAEGQSDQEIADRLFISPKTASVHVSNIKAKMGVERRVEATLLASRLVQGRHESA